jgi:hypothetical protein
MMTIACWYFLGMLGFGSEGKTRAPSSCQFAADFGFDGKGGEALPRLKSRGIFMPLFWLLLALGSFWFFSVRVVVESCASVEVGWVLDSTSTNLMTFIILLIPEALPYDLEFHHVIPNKYPFLLVHFTIPKPLKLWTFQVWVG